MRQPGDLPTPIEELLAWHRAEIAGECPDWDKDAPQCGWYRLRRKRGTPWLPTVIRCEQHLDQRGRLTHPEFLVADVFGETVFPATVWPWVEAITETEWGALRTFRLNNQHLFQDHVVAPAEALIHAPEGT
jgi:hypothetical protein